MCCRPAVIWGCGCSKQLYDVHVSFPDLFSGGLGTCTSTGVFSPFQYTLTRPIQKSQKWYYDVFCTKFGVPYINL